MEEKLDRILTRVTDWLKFAEAKNVAILAANAAAIFGITRLFVDKHDLGAWLRWYLIAIIVGAALGGIVALCSFLPLTNIPWLDVVERAQPHHNLIFFGDIARYEPAQYLDSLYKAFGLSGTPNRIETQYAEQIVVNSKVALRKYAFFRAALWITVAGIITPIGALMAYLYLRDKPLNPK